MKIKNFVFAAKVSEAYSLLQDFGDSAYLIAGGTSTFFMKSRISKDAIDINRIPIKGITKKKNSFEIGACTTINEIMEYSEEGWVLNRVALRFVNQHVRNISTIGGNISRVFYWSDFPVALRVLEGTLKITDSTTKKVNISEAFHNAQVHKEAFRNSILEYIEIPRLSKGMGFGYSKETRTSSAFSSATTAAFVKVEDGLISDIKIAFGAVCQFPLRLFKIEDSLKGQKADCSSVDKIDFDSLTKYKLVPREGMTLEYCKHLLKVKIKDVVCEAIAEATGASK
jgi:carbon-monoxide dehydrogenase medium subunit